MPESEDLELESESGEPLDPNVRKALREHNALKKELEETKAQMVQVQREAALTKAGIPDTPFGQFFSQNYQGEASPEAVREAAKAAGVLTEENGVPSQQQVDPIADSLAAQRRIQEAGGQPPPPPNAASDFNSAIGQAKSEAEVLAAINQYGRTVGVVQAGLS